METYGMESKKTFILKSSWIEVFSQLSDKQAGKLIKSLYSYNVNGDLPAQLDDMEVKAYFNMMKLECDEFLKNYDKRSVTSAVNGRKGGRPKKPNNLTKNLISYQKPKDKDKDKDNDIKETSLSGGKESPLPQSIFEKPLMDCYEELSSNQIWAETVTMNKRSSGHAEFSLESFHSYLKSFFEKLQNEGEAVKSPKDAMSHFARWLDIELRKPKPDAYKQANESLLASDEVSGNEVYGKFLGFIKANAPHCFACMRMPTAKEVDTLQKRQRAVGDNDLCKNAILEIEGKPILRERWDNLYLAIINQIKTTHGS
ncbi:MULTISPECIES: DUF6291 domain-containing protein [unclassified Bacteroides]|uniref:DUF6291 domain-containing protein n=1 Tax=unclassified Bacteroides TaxID=2646097 RepID=UPI0040629FFD